MISAQSAQTASSTAASQAAASQAAASQAAASSVAPAKSAAAPAKSAVAIQTAPVDSVLSDSASADSAISGEVLDGMVFTSLDDTYAEQPVAEAPGVFDGVNGMSWIYAGLVLLFIMVGLRFKNSSKYIKTLLSDLTDTRTRNNAFDDTVNETSVLILLNLLWCASCGVLLWTYVSQAVGAGTAASMSVVLTEPQGIAACIGVTGCYLLLMYLAYTVVGNVFTDSALTTLWVKGGAACTGLEAFLMFPVAILSLIYPLWGNILLVIAGIIFVIGKIVFIFKGFRIFFTQFSSWLLFLYYLCSLEIVPLVLTFFAAVAVCCGGI